jgi:hypothetical protein
MMFYEDMKKSNHIQGVRQASKRDRDKPRGKGMENSEP